jgi:hypothetical protein
MYVVYVYVANPNYAWNIYLWETEDKKIIILDSIFWSMMSY